MPGRAVRRTGSPSGPPSPKGPDAAMAHGMVMGIGRRGERVRLRASDRPDHVSSVRGDVHVTPGRHARHPPGDADVALAPVPEATRTSSRTHSGPRRTLPSPHGGRSRSHRSRIGRGSAAVEGGARGGEPKAPSGPAPHDRPRIGSMSRCGDPRRNRGHAAATGRHGVEDPRRVPRGRLGLRSSQALARGRPRAPVRVIPPRFDRSPWAAGVQGR